MISKTKFWEIQMQERVKPTELYTKQKEGKKNFQN